MEPLASSVLWVLNLDRIPWNLSFVSLFNQFMFYYQYLHYTTCISDITHYVSKYHSISLFNAHWNLFWSKSSMELSPEFHGTFWTIFEQHLWFHGIPWNLSNKTSSSMDYSCHRNQRSPSSMEFHGTVRVIEIGTLQVPWNSMDCSCQRNRRMSSSMEFYRTARGSEIGALQFHGTARVSEIGALWVPWNSMELPV